MIKDSLVVKCTVSLGIFHREPVEYFRFIGHRCFRMAIDIRERECSKLVLSLAEGKHALSLPRCPQQGRSHSHARSVLSVRERERREERQVCEPEGQAKGRPCLCESRERCWRLFSTSPILFGGPEFGEYYRALTCRTRYLVKHTRKRKGRNPA